MPPTTRQELGWRFITALWLTPLIALPYMGAGRVELRPVLWLKPGTMEAWIPVDTWLAPFVYLSYYPLLFFSGIVLSASLFRRYVLALAVASVLSVLIFLLLPSGVPRDGVDPAAASPLYRWLIEIDPPRNAFPSEHASLSLIAVLALSAADRPRWPKALGWLWLLLIYWSTIATRQHVFVDLASGAALGAAVWWWSGRRGGARRDLVPSAP